jgi:methionyl-tRNA formyltransferase
LAGDDMTEVFKNLENSGFNLLVKFLRNHINLMPLSVNPKTSFYRRRKREESKLTIKEIEKKGLIYIYNKIRSLTNPYPNAYLEDKKGNKLYFEKVKFKKK